ncbi:MAG: hypothetical protein WC792_05660 [Candidatus Micrarchaeia archaeon]
METDSAGFSFASVCLAIALLGALFLASQSGSPAEELVSGSVCKVVQSAEGGLDFLLCGKKVRLHLSQSRVLELNSSFDAQSVRRGDFLRARGDAYAGQSWKTVAPAWIEVLRKAGA